MTAALKKQAPRLDVARFDGIEAWAKLSRADQNRIGSVALELVQAGRSRAINDDPVMARALDAAGDLLSTRLDLAAVPAVGEFGPGSQVFVPQMLGMVCRECGCAEFDACPGGCHWVADGLCSSCAKLRGLS